MRLAQFLVRHRGLAQRRAAARRAATRSSGATRVAADHFGLDPQRDRRQRVTNLVRSPAFVAYLQAGQFDEPVTFHAPRGPGTLSGDDPALRRRHEARAVAGHHRARARRGDAARLRRQRLARDPHAADGAVRLRRDDAQPAARPRSSASACCTLMTQQTERMGHLVADLLTLAQLEGSPRPAADRWVPRRALVRATSRPRRGRSRPGATHRLRRAGAAPRSPAPRASCRARSPTSSATRCATRPTAAASTSRWRVRRRRQRRDRRRRHRPRHRPRAPAAPHRALLPRRRQPLARDRRHRARACRSSSTWCSATAASSTSRASSARARRSGSSFRRAGARWRQRAPPADGASTPRRA